MIDHDLPPSLLSYLENEGRGALKTCDGVPGGTINQTRRIETTGGFKGIAKFAADIPADFYAIEAQGLAELRGTGFRVPDVIATSADFILLEDLGTHPPEEVDWRAFGRAVARLHQWHDPLFGFAHDNYIGRLRQTNSRTANGHEFFAQHRIHAYLSLPLCELATTEDDRRNIGKFASKLADFIPSQPASLLHGDLWSGNIIPLGDGQAGLIDPAVYFGWAEADLTASWLYPGVPADFFDAYNEVNPLEPGYMERFPLLAVREWLAILAQFGPNPVVNNIRSVIAPYV
ncbi:fructosamine kinase family protein [Sphingomonas sp.]|uniref:fructosamine kinase family protein n=1 Tax=Sphingomonas sp. TaxID=28214 RepID=UPI0025F2D202|nr:fructosamine kinase family protein [Sphingomonas sp.]